LSGGPANNRRRLLLVLGLGVAGIVGMLLVPAIRQDPSYHRFADARRLLGVPNVLNVASNLPFAVIGALGLRFLLGEGVARFREPRERWAYSAFFAAVLLTAAGSAWYHLEPTDERLFWDRLPIALAVMALLAAIVAERVSTRAGAALLLPLLLLGVASVLHWRVTGDLRAYALVQYYPMAAIPLLLVLFPARYTRARDFAGVVAWYAGAKACELLDAPIFHALAQTLSGHTLKHLLGAGAAAWLLRMLARREPLPESLR
jgi:hypothetical protein